MTSDRAHWVLEIVQGSFRLGDSVLIRADGSNVRRAQADPEGPISEQDIRGPQMISTSGHKKNIPITWNHSNPTIRYGYAAENKISKEETWVLVAILNNRPSTTNHQCTGIQLIYRVVLRSWSRVRSAQKYTFQVGVLFKKNASKYDLFAWREFPSKSTSS